MSMSMEPGRPRPANNRIKLPCEERAETLNNYIAYEHARTYRHYVDRERIPIPWSGLELSYGSRVYRERSFLDAFPCAMGRFRTTARKRHSSILLVLEHRGKRAHVHLFYFPTRSRWHPRLSAELAHLHSQSDADSETQVCFYRG